MTSSGSKSAEDSPLLSLSMVDHSDLTAVFLLSIWTLGLNGLGLGEIEFFRHTEADRTLIAWEMLERGDFVMPHLLGSEILTKPPFFYWLVSISIALLRSAAESAARLPSVLVSLLFVLVQYVFWRREGSSRRIAALAAFMLSTSGSFFLYAAVAEIDMLYGFLSALALYCCYFALRSRSARWLVAMYGALGLAVLTKGPPVIAILLISYVAFSMLQERSFGGPLVKRDRFLMWHLVGVLAFLALISAWIIPIAERIGWYALWEHFDQEILSRVVSGGKHGLFFYCRTFVVSLLPWNIFLFLGGGAVLIRLRSGERNIALYPSREFVVFSATVVGVSLILLSLASGKSHRYFFPAAVFAVNLSCAALLNLSHGRYSRLPFSVGAWTAACILSVSLAVPLLLSFDAVPRSAVAAVSFAIGLGALSLFLSCRRKAAVEAVLSVGILFLVLRLAQTTVYAVHRNAGRSVMSMVEEIEGELPPSVPLYTLEMGERWVCYYLKRQGRECLRLTPQRALALASSVDTVFILLNGKEEAWRLDVLSKYDPLLRLLADIDIAKERFLLVRAGSSSLSRLELKRFSPVKPILPASLQPDGEGRIRQEDASLPGWRNW